MFDLHVLLIIFINSETRFVTVNRSTIETTATSQSPGESVINNWKQVAAQTALQRQSTRITDKYLRVHLGYSCLMLCSGIQRTANTSSQ